MDKTQVANRFCIGNMIVNAGLLVGGAAGVRNIDEFINNSFFRAYILAELERRGECCSLFFFFSFFKIFLKSISLTIYCVANLLVYCISLQMLSSTSSSRLESERFILLLEWLIL